MSRLEELIDKGYEVKEKCKSGDGMKILSGPEYAEWLMLCTRYLNSCAADDEQVKKFVELAERANGNFENVFDTLIGILKAFKEIPKVEGENNIEIVLEKICTNFHRCAKSLLNRHSGRQTLEINDEYDMQDLLQGILGLFIDDVRPEDYAPSYAGGNSRTDFYLPAYDTYIETKMIRSGLHDKEVGEQLIVDIARYGNKCNNLICFIYDKNNELQNPYGLINDLQKLGNDEVNVKVYISPL